MICYEQEDKTIGDLFLYCNIFMSKGLPDTPLWVFFFVFLSTTAPQMQFTFSLKLCN